MMAEQGTDGKLNMVPGAGTGIILQINGLNITYSHQIRSFATGACLPQRTTIVPIFIRWVQVLQKDLNWELPLTCHHRL